MDTPKIDENIKIDDVRKTPKKPSCWLNLLKILGAVSFIYIFIFSIGLLSDSFQVLGGAFLNEMIDEVQRKLPVPYVSYIFMPFEFNHLYSRYYQHSLLWFGVRNTSHSTVSEFFHLYLRFHHARSCRPINRLTGDLLRNGRQHWYLNYQHASCIW